MKQKNTLLLRHIRSVGSTKNGKYLRTLSKINNLKYCLRQNYAQIIYRIYLINYSILLLISSRLLYVLFFFLCDLNSSVVNNFVIVYGKKKTKKKTFIGN